MARPLKMGIDYFPLDVVMDNNIRAMTVEIGCVGYGVLIRLWQRIYSEGFYFNISKTDELLLMASEFQVTFGALKEFIECFVRRGLFDKNIYKQYKVLTSRGIQKRYFTIAGKRSPFHVEEKYLLLSADELPKNVIINGKNKVNNNDNSINDVDNPQSKGNKSKGDTPADSQPSLFAEDSKEVTLAKFLYNKMLENNSNAKYPNIQKWAKCIDLLLRVDKRDVKVVESMIKFSQWDDFWKGTVLSPESLRKNFDKLLVQAEIARKKVVNKQ